MSYIENIKSANELESERILGLIYEIANRPVAWAMPYLTHDELRRWNDLLESDKDSPIWQVFGHILRLN